MLAIVDTVSLLGRGSLLFDELRRCGLSPTPSKVAKQISSCRNSKMEVNEKWLKSTVVL